MVSLHTGGEINRLNGDLRSVNLSKNVNITIYEFYLNPPCSQKKENKIRINPVTNMFLSGHKHEQTDSANAPKQKGTERKYPAPRCT